jgi:hypothetical protein
MQHPRGAEETPCDRRGSAACSQAERKQNKSYFASGFARDVVACDMLKQAQQDELRA